MCPVVQPKEKKATDGGREGLCDLSFGGGQVGRAKLGLSSCFHAHGGVHYFRAVRTS